MNRQMKLGLVGLVALSASPAFALQSNVEQPPAHKTPAADPNSRVCEDVVQTGSRLNKQRFCGTRAEWADKKRQDREATEKAQTQLCVNNPATKQC
jgi:hypothetical protein